MRKKAFILAVCAAVFTVFPLCAQTESTAHSGHLHERNEIGFSVSGVYEIDHEAWTSGYHLDYFRTLTPSSRWALGGGIEYLKGAERHFEVGFGARYEPLPLLHLTLMPGVTFTDRARFSIHAEAVYEVLIIGNLHFGPTAGYAWSNGHSHLSIGLHAAVAF